jgi:uncharacterized protein YehS (DUF1456 family)
MNNLNTARAKSGTATADDTEVVDFAERLRYVMKLKVNKLKTIMQKSNTHLEADMSMIVTQALEWVQGRIQDIILNNVRTDWLVYNDK